MVCRRFETLAAPLLRAAVGRSGCLVCMGAPRERGAEQQGGLEDLPSVLPWCAVGAVALWRAGEAAKAVAWLEAVRPCMFPESVSPRVPSRRECSP